MTASPLVPRCSPRPPPPPILSAAKFNPLPSPAYNGGAPLLECQWKRLAMELPLGAEKATMQMEADLGKGEWGRRAAWREGGGRKQLKGARQAAGRSVFDRACRGCRSCWRKG